MHRRTTIPVAVVFAIIVVSLLLMARSPLARALPDEPAAVRPLDSLGAPGTPTPLSCIDPHRAFENKLQSYLQATAADMDLRLGSIQIDRLWAYAVAQSVDGSGQAIPYEFVVLLARCEPSGDWFVVAPKVDRTDEYNSLLGMFPDEFVDQATKAYLAQPELSQRVLAPSNFSGHRLPWPATQIGYVTKKDGVSHENQVDFDIRGGGISGDVFASRPGTVVFVKESSNSSCSIAPPDPCWKKANMVVVQHGTGEYSWYVHLAYNSVAVSVGNTVGFGTKIGIEGQTGYASGVHLHYMGSTGYSGWTDPNNPDDAPWGTGITAVDFTEISWAGLTVTQPYTSQNAGDACQAPVLVSPADGYVHASSDRTITFSWSALSGCTFNGYTFRVKNTADMDSGGTTIIDTGEGGTSRTETFGSQWDIQDLYWGVRAANAPNGASWSVRRFRICPGCSSGNWHEKYFDNQDCTTYNCSTSPRCERDFSGELNFNWGTGKPDCVSNGDNWSALYTGRFNFPSGNYVFHVDHDDGIKLWLDGANIQDVWGDTGTHHACPPRPLSGDHDIALNFRENSGDARVHLWWDTDSTPCQPPCYPLSTSVNPNGAGTVNASPGPNCGGGTGYYTSGTVVQLTASANSGYTFANWSGDATGTANPVSVTMNGHKSVTADFASPGGVTLSLSPSTSSVRVGQIFTLDIRVDLGTATADTVDAYVDYDPAYLQVVDAAGNPVTSIELNTAVFNSSTTNSVNNTTGQINFSASKYDSPYLTGSFKAATIRFKAKAAVTSTSVVFVRSETRWSDVLRAAGSLNPTLSGATVTITPSVTLNGRVALERRGAAGDPRWVTELHRVNAGVTTGGIEVYQAGTSSLLGAFSATTDAIGGFSVALTGLGSGVYDIEVRGGDTLRNEKLGISLPGGEVNFGTLLVGDCNGNDAVNGGDVSYMIPAFTCCEADACYRPYADVNKEGCVNGGDASALIPNFLKTGPMIVSAQAQADEGAGQGASPISGASLVLTLTAQTVKVGDIFTVDVMADTGTDSADTVDVYIDFGPGFLEVVDTSGQPAAAIELNTAVFNSATYNAVDNPVGHIDLSASKYESPYLSGAFRVATIRFRAKAAVASTDVRFVRSGARWSDLYQAGESLDPTLEQATVTITATLLDRMAYLPIILR
jgi:murein DD-endopeptidase MepM/ murein hydrolase activator NlpD